MQHHDRPDDDRPTSTDGRFILVVDGETFFLEVRSDGGTSYDWVSGPNEGYGMDSSPSMAAGQPDLVVQPVKMARHIESIMAFLAAVDPETGYLGD